MRKLFILLAGAAVITTAACNTIAGMGRDVESAGEAVSSTANDAKN